MFNLDLEEAPDVLRDLAAAVEVQRSATRTIKELTEKLKAMGAAEPEAVVAAPSEVAVTAPSPSPSPKAEKAASKKAEPKKAAQAETKPAPQAWPLGKRPSPPEGWDSVSSYARKRGFGHSMLDHHVWKSDGSPGVLGALMNEHRYFETAKADQVLLENTRPDTVVGRAVRRALAPLESAAPPAPKPDPVPTPAPDPEPMPVPDPTPASAVVAETKPATIDPRPHFSVFKAPKVIEPAARIPKIPHKDLVAIKAAEFLARKVMMRVKQPFPGVDKWHVGDVEMTGVEMIEFARSNGADLPHLDEIAA